MQALVKKKLFCVRLSKQFYQPINSHFLNSASSAHRLRRDNGHKALNDLLAPTLGYLVYQEQIIAFLNQFCGYTMGEADIVRRGFAKKTGTEQFIPQIKSGFIKTMKEIFRSMQEESEKNFAEKEKEADTDGSMIVRGSREFIKELSARLNGKQISKTEIVDTETGEVIKTNLISDTN